MLCVPVPPALRVYLPAQLAELPLPKSVQLVALKVPAPLLLKLTVPVGVLFVPTSVSATVAVQVVGCPTTTDGGVQLTPVLVERVAITATVVVPELPVWVASRPPPRGWCRNCGGASGRRRKWG